MTPREILALADWIDRRSDETGEGWDTTAAAMGLSTSKCVEAIRELVGEPILLPSDHGLVVVRGVEDCTGCCFDAGPLRCTRPDSVPSCATGFPSFVIFRKAPNAD